MLVQYEVSSTSQGSVMLRLYCYCQILIASHFLQITNILANWTLQNKEIMLKVGRHGHRHAPSDAQVCPQYVSSLNLHQHLSVVGILGCEPLKFISCETRLLIHFLVAPFFLLWSIFFIRLDLCFGIIFTPVEVSF